MSIISLLLLFTSLFRGRFLFSIYILQYLLLPSMYLSSNVQFSDSFTYYIHLAILPSIVFSSFFLIQKRQVWLLPKILRPPLLVPRKNFLVILFLVSIFASLFYLFLVRDSFSQILLNYTSGESLDYSGLRISMYDSKNSSLSTFPGFFNQFKNILVPFLSTWFLTVAFRNFNFQKTAYGFFVFTLKALLLISISSISLGVTFQRSGIIFNIIAICLSILYFSRVRFIHLLSAKVPKKLIIVSSVLIALSFVCFLYWNQSTDALYSDYNSRAQLFNRVFSEQYIAASATFSVAEANGIQFGMHLFKSFLGIVPVLKSVIPFDDLAYQGHAICCGSYRGTAPLDYIGVAWYNFGSIGVVIWSICICLVSCSLESLIQARKQIISTQSFTDYAFNVLLVIFTGLFFILAIGDPVQVLNNGMILLLFLFYGWGSNKSRSNIS